MQSQTSAATHASSAESESCRRQVLFAGAAAALLTLTPSNAEADDLVEFRPGEQAIRLVLCLICSNMFITASQPANRNCAADSKQTPVS